MKYRSLCIALFLLGGTSHISACEPENENTEKTSQPFKCTKFFLPAEKTMYSYETLFENSDIPKFIYRFFKHALLEKEYSYGEPCCFYWHPCRPITFSDIDNYTESLYFCMTRAKSGAYKVAFKDNYGEMSEAIQKLIEKDSEILKDKPFKLKVTSYLQEGLYRCEYDEQRGKLVIKKKG